MKQKRSEKLSVLAYHKINDEINLEKQILFLKKRYDIISLSDLHNFFYSGGKLPAKPLLITFDDGDFSLYQNAFPVLKNNKIPAVIFVVTDLINSEKPFWWDEIEYYLESDAGYKKTWEVKTWPNIEREEFLRNMKLKSEKKDFKYPQLTTSELKEMQEAGISIANHSHTHPMFDRCTKEELQVEMQNSNKILDDLKLTPDAFAYPNGNVSEKSEEIIKENRIKMAFLFDHQINKKSIHPFRISRLVVNDTTPLWKFKFILSGWHSRFLPVIKQVAKLNEKV